MATLRESPAMTPVNGDWVGHWFRLMQDRGFEMINRYGCVTGPTDDDVEWHLLPHWEFDGVGAFVHLLRQKGIDPSIPTLPPRRRGSGWGLRWLTMIRGIISYLKVVPIHAALWKRLEVVAGLRREAGQTGLCVYRILSPEETRRLIERARALNVSVHSHLHWSVAETVKGELQEGTGPHLWMVPVNMRGAVRKSPDTSNHQSLVWVDTGIARAAKDIDRQLEKRFGEAIHWGAWLVLNLGRLIGEKGMKRLLDRVERIGDRWVGTFSNLGAWKIESGPWIGFVPVSRSSPLGASCVTVNDRMSLMLQAQPEICGDRATLERWLARWAAHALDAPPATSPPAGAAAR